MPLKVKLIDNDGLTYEIKHFDAMIEGANDGLLINSYQSTLYWHHLNEAMTELVDKGILEQKKGDKFDSTTVKLGLSLLKKELIDRVGMKDFKLIEGEVDLSFLKNKPKL